MSNHLESTVEWYVQWLADRYPDWTPEQRIEIATGFAEQQQPPKAKLPEEDIEEDSQNNARPEERKDARRRTYLTDKELTDILAPPPEIADDKTTGQ